MKTMKRVPILLALAIALVFDGNAEAQSKIPLGVFGNGGVPLNGGGYRLSSTVGQPVIGVAVGPSHIDESGFWYQTIELSTSVEPIPNSLPTEFRLEQNYPNPFNPTATIVFAIPKRSSVTLKLLDVLGRERVTLVDARLEPGEYKIFFDGKELSTGMYFYRLQAEGFVQTKKLQLLK